MEFTIDEAKKTLKDASDCFEIMSDDLLEERRNPSDITIRRITELTTHPNNIAAKILIARLRSLHAELIKTVRTSMTPRAFRNSERGKLLESMEYAVQTNNKTMLLEVIHQIFLSIKNIMISVSISSSARAIPLMYYCTYFLNLARVKVYLIMIRKNIFKEKSCS